MLLGAHSLCDPQFIQDLRVLPLDQPAIIPSIEFSLANEVIKTINVVLREVIPGMEIALAPLGNEFRTVLHDKVHPGPLVALEYRCLYSFIQMI